ncbi:glyoxylate/hydroxypyruvate reductase A [Pandoraea faecigallinarum]|uniref:Glyoxylate/hydroxypyruvate reductase A n=1 Tax=Pandoraea faecigallinarum TaxID=656179 RepID=A0A0H3WSB2_9BURK|nr:glyoxylate/hydroxypyruvate reductase A [Pandoraea faecigallinarum]AKM31089.1 glyoxylate/hydroxypyruvate reductase A [Pandoraea faecigallinarum]
MQGDTLLIKSGGAAALTEWQHHFARLLPGLRVYGWDDPFIDPRSVKYALVYQPDHGRLAHYPRLKLILSAAAGVDHILADPALPANVPIVRMVTDETRERMSDFVTFAALAIVRDMPALVVAQREGHWANELTGRLARDTRVSVLGLGELGSAVARRLHANGFRVNGWARTPKALAGVNVFAGEDQFDALIAQTDILVNLLPDTLATRGILGRRLFARLPAGASIIQVGRGAHLDRQALIDALDSGRLRSAVVDVFDVEPLPPEDALRRHPKVLVTPHIASTVSYAARARQVADVLGAHARGAPLPFVYDAIRGY